jgi:uncharacterized protein YgiB involved in biofilm formation
MPFHNGGDGGRPGRLSQELESRLPSLREGPADEHDCCSFHSPSLSGWLTSCPMQNGADYLPGGLRLLQQPGNPATASRSYWRTDSVNSSQDTRFSLMRRALSEGVP